MFEEPDDELERILWEAEKYTNVQPRLAIPLYRAYLKHRDDEYYVWYNLGSQYTMIQQDEDAMECYDEGLKYIPEEEAKPFFSEVVCETISSLYFNKAQIFMRQEKFRYAAEAYKASNFWWSSHDTYEGLCVAYADMGEKLTAMAIYLSTERTN
jgi:tetratricopeptide (TPR) repeat protein